MNKSNKTIIILVVIVLVLIVGYMLLSGGEATPPEGEVQGVETEAPATDMIVEEGTTVETGTEVEVTPTPVTE